MSIIYEALKRIERRGAEEQPQPTFQGRQKKQPKLLLLIIFVGFVIFLSLFSIINSSRKKDVPPVSQVKPPVSVEVVAQKEPPKRNFTKKQIIQEFPKGTYTLQGILYTQDDPISLINGKRVRKGETIDGAELTAIYQKGVELTSSGGRIHLPLED